MPCVQHHKPKQPCLMHVHQDLETLLSIPLSYSANACAGHPWRWHHRQELQGGEPDHVSLRPHHRQELRGQFGLQGPEHRLQRPDPQTSFHHQLHHVSPVSRSLSGLFNRAHEVWTRLNAFCCRNVNGITFVGSVKEKTVARNLYAQARARGKAAGIVRYRSSLLDLRSAVARQTDWGVSALQD